VHAWSTIVYFLSQRGCRLDCALAAVEDEQHLFVPEKGDQSSKWIFRTDRDSKHGRQRTRHKHGIGNRPKIDESDPVSSRHATFAGPCTRTRSLADPAGSGNRDEAPLRHLGSERTYNGSTSDHSRDGDRKVVRRLP